MMLRADGLAVQRERIRDSLHYVNPIGIETQLRSRVHCSQYIVPYSTYLWHIDAYQVVPVSAWRDRWSQCT